MRRKYEEVCKIISDNKIETSNGVLTDYSGYPIEAELDTIFEFYSETLRLQGKDYGIAPAILYFENSISINALASKQKNFFIVGINLGTIIYLKNTFKENEALLKVNHVEDYVEFEKSLDTPIQILMYQLTKHFTMYHEIGHLIQKSDYLNFLICEKLVEQGEFDCKRHVCELDADSFSSLCVGSHILQYAKSQFGNKPTQEQIEKLTVIICSAALFYILSFQDESLTIYYKEKSHPHPSIRITHVIMTIINYILQAFPQECSGLNLTSKSIVDKCVDFSVKISQNMENKNLINNYIKLITNERQNILDYLTQAKKHLDSDPSLASNKWNQVAAIT